MILLSFTVRNHKSIREEVTLDLIKPSLKTLQPKDGNWNSVSYSLAGIFGGNATGKSAILDALHYAFSAVESSATAWQQRRSMPRAPFVLDENSRTASSEYELDLVYEGRRYLYGFEVDGRGIKGEWLRDLPRSRWRTLLNRNREENLLTFHQTLRTRVDVTPRELVLSRARLLEDGSLLHAFARDLVDSFDIALVNDSYRERQLQRIADSLAEGDIAFADIEALLEIADIGISKVDVEEEELPEKVLQTVMLLRRQIAEDYEEKGGNSDSENQQKEDKEPLQLTVDELDKVVRSLRFTHRGAGSEGPVFSIGDESDGTIAWLALAVPALEKLRHGGLLVVDEIDASLHPYLLDMLLGIFADPSINTRHAQLIFTSHESYVMSRFNDLQLDPEQIWFTDKSYEGATELTCLADFPQHPDANIAKRYLAGRYAGTPRLSPHSFSALIGSREGYCV